MAFPEGAQLLALGTVSHITEQLVVIQAIHGTPPVDEGTVLWSEAKKSLSVVCGHQGGLLRGLGGLLRGAGGGGGGRGGGTEGAGGKLRRLGGLLRGPGGGGGRWGTEGAGGKLRRLGGLLRGRVGYWGD